MPLALLGFHHLGGQPRSFNNGHVITNVTEMLLAPGDVHEDTEFEKLDVRTQEEIQQQMYEVEQSIRASTRFLTTNPNQLSMGSYDTQFNSGAADEHCMDQYLFNASFYHVSAMWISLFRNKLL